MVRRSDIGNDGPYAIFPQSKTNPSETPHRKLLEDNQEVEIFYEAVWDPTSPLAADLAALTASISHV